MKSRQDAHSSVVAGHFPCAWLCHVIHPARKYRHNIARLSRNQHAGEIRVYVHTESESGRHWVTDTEMPNMKPVIPCGEHQGTRRGHRQGCVRSHECTSAAVHRWKSRKRIPNLYSIIDNCCPPLKIARLLSCLSCCPSYPSSSASLPMQPTGGLLLWMQILDNLISHMKSAE